MPTFTCKCGSKNQIPESALGQRIECPNCQKVFVIKAPPKPQPPVVVQPMVVQSQPPQAPFPAQASPPAAPYQQPLYPPQPQYQPQPYGQRHPARKQKRSYKAVIIIGSVIGCLFLGILGLGIAAMVMSGNKDGGSGGSGTIATNFVAKPVNKDEAKKVAEQLMVAFESPNHTASGKLIDWDELLGRSIAGIQLSDKDRKEMMRGMKAGGAVKNFHRQIHQIAREQLNDVLSVRDVDGETRALCRFFSSENGLVYMDFIFHEDKAGNVKVADMYSIGAGQKTTETMSQLLNQVAKSLNKNVIQRMTSDDVFMENIGKVQQIKNLSLQNPRAAMAMFKQLPDEMKNQKAFMLMRLQLATSLDDREYMAAMEAFRGRFGNDPALMLLSIDYYLLKEDYPKLMESIDRLNENVGGDPALDYMTASFHYMEGDIDRAKIGLEGVVAVAPDFHPAYENLIGIDMDNGDFEKVYERLVQFKKLFPNVDVGLHEYANFPQFQRSSYYRQWTSRR
jgi:tetratricopeptide (TPR) repeat protein